MPRRTLRQFFGVSAHSKLLIMIFLGMFRNALNWLSFTWNGNVQEIWDLLGPEPSFSLKFHFDYWLKTILSVIELFRNYTTHLHFFFYIILLYPVVTGDQHRLMLPWLHLQFLRNIGTKIICTVVGVLRCWLLRISGLLGLEFLIVQIISMMPSVYLWRRLRAYYFDLYYAELDGDYSFSMIKPDVSLTLAQRRRAAKSLDGAIIIPTSSDEGSRINSCLTYDEFFGQTNWEKNSENKISKSLTTLLTIESQEFEDDEVDSTSQIIDDENLTPAEKSMKILGLTREDVDATVLQFNKKTSTTNMIEPSTDYVEQSINESLDFSFFSVTEETTRPRTVATQVRISPGSKVGSERLSEKCACCEETKCSVDDDQDSDSEGENEPSSQVIASLRNAPVTKEVDNDGEDHSSRGKSLNCCDQNRKWHETESSNKKMDDANVSNRNNEVTHIKFDTESNVASTSLSYRNSNSHPSTCFQALVERDGIAWENLQEINFVSVINKALCDNFGSFKLPRSYVDSKKLSGSIASTSKIANTDINGAQAKYQINKKSEAIIPERENGIPIDKKFFSSDKEPFSIALSASFGVDSDILTLNASQVLNKLPFSHVQSFGSTSVPTNSRAIPVHDAGLNSYFKSGFHDSKTEFGSLKNGTRSSIYGATFELNDVHDNWRFSRETLAENEINCENGKPKDSSLNSQISYDYQVSFETLKNNEDATVAPCLKSVSKIVENNEKSTTNHLAEVNESVINEKFSTKYKIEKFSKDRQSLTSSSKSLWSSKSHKTSEEWEAKAIQALKAYNEKTLFKYKTELDARKNKNIKNTRNSSRYNKNECQNSLTGFRFSTQQQGPSYFDQNYTDPLNSPGTIYGSNFNQALLVPSAPELETPEKELILNIENAYARFTRSKPTDPATNSVLYENSATKEFADLYSSGGRLKKESQRAKINDETSGRKQHSKYSKLSRVTNESDVTSKSCKRIEGSQKGRELDRILARENIRSQEMEVYFLERQTDDKSSTSKNLPITIIKPFSPKRDEDSASTASSETLTPNASRSPMIEVLENPEEIPSRIEENEFYRQLRKKNIPKNVKEAMRNIDWSFRSLNYVESDRPKHKQIIENTTVRTDHSLERQNIVQKTTEHLLQSAFAYSENSERGFRLGETADQYYPIFNNAAITIGEIVKAAALRGYRDEFTSQPAREIEVPEIDEENFYGHSDQSRKLQRRSSSREFLKCNVLIENTKVSEKRSMNEKTLSIPTSTILDDVQEKYETTTDDEKVSSLLKKLMAPVESRLAKVKSFNEPEDIPEEQEDTSGDLPSLQTNQFEDYSNFLFKDTSTTKRSPTSSRCHNIERSIHGGPKTKKCNEQVKLALQDIIRELPSTIQGSSLEIPRIADNEDSRYKFDFTSCQHILNCFNNEEKETQSMILKFIDQFSDCETIDPNGDINSQLLVALNEKFSKDLIGSELITGIEMMNILKMIKITAEKIRNVTEYREGSEETSTSSVEESSLEQNERPEHRSTSEQTTTYPETTSTRNIGFETINTSTQNNDLEDRKKINGSTEPRVIIRVESDLKSRVSSLEKFNQPPNDNENRLLKNISDGTVSPSSSELLRRTNFRQNVIDSVFVEVIKRGNSVNRSVTVQKEAEEKSLVTNIDDTKFVEESLTVNSTELDPLNRNDLMDIESESDGPELWITDDDEQMTSRNAVVHIIEDEYLSDNENIAPDIVLRDIKIAECAIKKIKTVLEKFSSEGKKGEEENFEKYESSVRIKNKIPSLTNLRFSVNEELQKLQNFIQVVENYTVIIESSSGLDPDNEMVQSFSAVNLLHEQNSFNERSKDTNAAGRSERSDNVDDKSESLLKNGETSNINNNQTTENFLPKPRGSSKNLEGSSGSKKKIDPFSSWDKMIPVSCKLEIAKNKRKNKSKKVVATREAPRRVVKVVRLIKEKSLDYFGAKSVPQRGRGLSSGYLMDSDSDGNFTVSRPPTPASVESVTSQNLSHDINDENISELPNTPPNSENNLLSSDSESKTALEKIADNIESPEVEQSLEISRNSMIEDTETPFETELKYKSPIDAAEIVNRLKDELQKILNHQFSGVNCLTNGLPTVSRDENFVSFSGGNNTDSKVDLQSNKDDLEEDVKDQKLTKEDCQKRVKEIFTEADDELVEQLATRCRVGNSLSENSDAVSIEVLQRKSRISLRDVAIETEHNVEVFKELLEIFAKFNATEINALTSHASTSSDVESVNNRIDLCSPMNIIPEKDIVKFNEGSNVSKQIFDSYDSYASLYYQDSKEFSEPFGREVSISNHTFLEDFPEQADRSNELLSKSSEMVDKRSSQLMNYNSELDAEETSSKKESSTGNSSKNSSRAGLNDQSSSRSNGEPKKDAVMKKTAIPRPVKDNQKRR